MPASSKPPLRAIFAFSLLVLASSLQPGRGQGTSPQSGPAARPCRQRAQLSPAQAQHTSSWSRSTVSAGTMPRATTPRICSRSASRASGRPKACCPATPRSPFPTTSPSSPASIRSTTAWSPTASSTRQRQARYGIGDPKAVTDGSWYSGMPLWSLAESQGMRAACLFWPGSEAKIAGFGPPGTRASTPKPRPRPLSSRRASTMPWPCSSLPPTIVRTSSPSTTPSPTTKATSSAPTPRKPGPP